MFEFFQCIVKALAFMQKIGVAHRDISLNNIMIAEDSKFKVVDFGEMKLKESIE